MSARKHFKPSTIKLLRAAMRRKSTAELRRELGDIVVKHHRRIQPEGVPARQARKIREVFMAGGITRRQEEDMIISFLESGARL